MSAIDGFRLRGGDIEYLGTELSRPECVVAERDGTLWVSDLRGALTRIGADGGQRLVGPKGGVPNGVALCSDGRFLVADIEEGCVFRLDRDGGKTVLVDQLDGERLGAVNFVYLDDAERMWIPVSTRCEPRSAALESAVADGYILLVDGTGARIVADGFRFTNEVRLHGPHLYVAETTAGCVTRFTVAHDGTLSGRETFGPEPLFPGAMVDGITFDAEGNLWVTEITRNGLFVIKPDGEAVKIFEDPDGTFIRFPTSIAFGGDDLRTVYVGSLKMNRISRFASPVPGAPMRHWRAVGAGGGESG
ncbi:SMP-30/gluconolactonase/LRE family protein [Streptomyces sp. HNM0575]|uniref:SMP-30/gluconolactonase/LRE family protein n=1 Tax=Streptomyces sp. HNM0575 TaxID=2716338 RepID=UPI00145DE48F|nr:SMP-30/gluconolactonase/LRE family protein [Streptomyces sp. HNM0575]NLU73404.1 SMP-30/gluconolactonase/LRE family protein [Streptomyces sp. HNM0575]